MTHVIRRRVPACLPACCLAVQIGKLGSPSKKGEHDFCVKYLCTCTLKYICVKCQDKNYIHKQQMDPRPGASPPGTPTNTISRTTKLWLSRRRFGASLSMYINFTSRKGKKSPVAQSQILLPIPQFVQVFECLRAWLLRRYLWRPLYCTAPISTGGRHNGSIKAFCARLRTESCGLPSVQGG
jgi:hypothetical protein